MIVDEYIRIGKAVLLDGDLDTEAEAAEGAYYFDYIYKHGEHPR